MSGVLISGNSNQMQGNYVGTDASGTASLGNSFDGVAVGGTNNAILSNAIFSNGQLGIDLSPDGVSANDPGDPDFGANNLQNFPALTSAEVNNDGSTTIEGTLDSTPGTTFTVQFFASPSADPSNHGEGRIYLGQKTDVTTGAGGTASFSFTTQENISGQYVAATATSPTNDTSEFSEVERVPEANVPPVNSVPGAQSTNEDSALVFSGANGNQLSVSDPDAAPNPVKVRLQADHGTLTLDGRAELQPRRQRYQRRRHDLQRFPR